MVRTRLEMPFLMTLGMAFSALCAGVAAIVLPLTLLGFGSVSLGDSEAAPGLEWLAAVTLQALVAGLLGAIAYGYRAEKVWARPLAPLFWLISVTYTAATAVVSADERADMIMASIQCLVFLAAALWYFYRKPAVVAYYQAIERREPSVPVTPAGVGV